MGKRKVDKCTEDLKVSQRTKKDPTTIKGILKESNICLKITATPEDWEVFRNFYLPFKKELHRDLFPFMQAGFFKAQGKTTHKKNYYLVRVIQTQSALLYGFMQYIIQNSLWDRLPSLKRIKVKEDFNKNNPKEITFYFMGCVYRDIANYNKLKMFTGNQGLLYDKVETFFNKHVKKGEQILLQNGKNLYDANSLLHSLPKLAGVGIKDVYDFLLNLDRSICIKYRSSITGKTIKSVNNPKELDLMKDILIKVLPSLQELE